MPCGRPASSSSCSARAAPDFHTYAKTALGAEITPSTTKHFEVFFATAVEKLLDYERVAVRTFRVASPPLHDQR